ncbi:E3 ubiquitin ligase family protein [Synechococcus sp. H60.4]
MSEFSRQPCVYYQSEISWEYEEVECYRKYLNSEGEVVHSERISEREYQKARLSGSRSKTYPGKMMPKPGSSYSDSGSFPKKPSYNYPKEGRFQKYPNSDALDPFPKKAGYSSYPQKSVSAGYPEKSQFSQTDRSTKYYDNVYYDPHTNCEYLLERETNTRRETLHSAVRQIPFFLEDETGRVRVDPSGAEIEPKLMVEERVFPGQSPSRCLFDLRPYAPRLGSENRSTRFFTYKEWAIPVDEMAFAMGQVRFEAGEPVIRKPVTGGRFTLALKPPEAFLAEHRSQANNHLTTAVALLGIGVFTVLYLLQSS